MTGQNALEPDDGEMLDWRGFISSSDPLTRDLSEASRRLSDISAFWIEDPHALRIVRVVANCEE
jgi:hypothetical protein